MRQNEESQALIDAVNLIGRYIESNIADGWEIEMRFNAIECYVTLSNANGDEIDVCLSGDYSTIIELCEASKELDELEDR